jgi:hypothetical protein
LSAEQRDSLREWFKKHSENGLVSKPAPKRAYHKAKPKAAKRTASAPTPSATKPANNILTKNKTLVCPVGEEMIDTRGSYQHVRKHAKELGLSAEETEAKVDLLQERITALKEK